MYLPVVCLFSPAQGVTPTSTTEWYVEADAKEQDNGSSNLDLKPRPKVEPPKKEKEKEDKEEEEVENDEVPKRKMPPPVKPRKHLPASRTRSSPLLTQKEACKQKERRTRRKLVRSISDPDVKALSTSPPETNGGVPGKKVSFDDTAAQHGIQMRNKEKLTSPPPIVRYSQDTVESAAKAIEELLAQTPAQSPPPQVHSRPSFRPLTKAFQKATGKHSKKEDKEDKKAKRVGRIMTVLQDGDATSLEGTDVTGGNDDVFNTTRSTRSSSHSPQESPSLPTKSKGSSIFKRKKNRKDSSSRLSPERSDTPSSSSASAHPPPSGHRATFSHSGSTSAADDRNHHVPTISSPALVSHERRLRGGTIIDPSSNYPPLKSSPAPVTENFDLQRLIVPVCKSWLRCGYLWLRMKLPNNRYAWTHIVSLCPWKDICLGGGGFIRLQCGRPFCLYCVCGTNGM